MHWLTNYAFGSHLVDWGPVSCAANGVKCHVSCDMSAHGIQGARASLQETYEFARIASLSLRLRR
jgi:hypothetical protein